MRSPDDGPDHVAEVLVVLPRRRRAGSTTTSAARLVRRLGEAGLRVRLLAPEPGLPEDLLGLVRRGLASVLVPGTTPAADAVLLVGGADLPRSVRTETVLVVPAGSDGEEVSSEVLRRAAAGGRRPVPARGPAPGTVDRRVLLISSNGSGMGHLTRLVAMARRRRATTAVHVLSMSSAVPLAAGDELPYEYVPSADDLGISARRWNPLLQKRLDRTMADFRPDVVVFDGTYPYRPVAELHDRHPGVRTVWSRRPMWKPGRGERQLRLSDDFDLVVEPGELAADLDAGLTVGRTDALRVRPVTLLDPEDALPRAEARAALGLHPDRPAALLTMGAGNWQEVDSDLGALVTGLRRGAPDAVLHLVRPAIARSTADLGEGVRALSAYPLSRYLPAFDLVATAAGYNTFHETVSQARPGAYVGVETQLDDQPRRARWAEREGTGLALSPREPASVERAVRLLLDEGMRRDVAERCRAAWPGNGARDAMRAVERLADGEFVASGEQR